MTTVLICENSLADFCFKRMEGWMTGLRGLLLRAPSKLPFEEGTRQRCRGTFQGQVLGDWGSWLRHWRYQVAVCLIQPGSLQSIEESQLKKKSSLSRRVSVKAWTCGCNFFVILKTLVFYTLLVDP